MAPSPAAGKATGGAPRTPTKLGRKPQSSQTPKLGQAASSAASSAKPSTSKPNVEKPDTSSVPQKPETGDVAEQAQDTAKGATEKAGEAAGDASEKAKGVPEEASKVEMKDATEGATGDDEDEEDDDEGPLSKVSQAGDKAKGGLEEADPKPIDDDNDDTVEGAQETAEEATDDADDIADDATEKAGDTADDVEDATDDAQETAGKVAGDAQDSAEQTGGNLLKGAKGLAGKASGLAGKAAQDPAKAAKEAPGDVEETAGDVADDAQKTAGDAAEDVEETAGDAAEGAEDLAEGAKDTAGDAAEDAKDTAGDAAEGAEDLADDAKDTAEGAADEAGEGVDGVKEEAEGATDDLPTGEAPDLSSLPLDLSVLKGLEVGEDGNVLDQEGNPVGKLAEGDAEDLAGYPIGDDGEILDDDGDLVGRVELLPDEVKKQLSELKEKGELPEGAEGILDQLPDEEGAFDATQGIELLNGLTCDPTGIIYNEDGDTIGQVIDGNPEELMNATLNEQGEFIDEDGNVVGHAQIHPDAADIVEQAQEAKEGAEDAAEDAQDAAADAQETAEGIEDELPGIEALQGKELNDAGEIVDDEGNLLGQIDSDELKEKLESGELKAEDLKINEEGEVVDAEGNVLGNVGLAEGAAEKLAAATGPVTLDLRILDGKKINKKGKILDEEGEEIGELTEGDIKACAGQKANDKGEVLDKSGNVIGKVSVVPGEAAETATKELLAELGELPEEAEEAVEDVEEEAEAAGPQFKIPDLDVLEGLKVNKKGKILNEDGDEIGELTSGDLAECAGKKVNAQGEVLDAEGNVIGRVKALPQELTPEEVEAAEEAEEGAEDAAEDAEGAAEDAQDAAEDAQDAAEDAEDAGPELPPLSVLEGLKVNKAGKLVDSNGVIVGELTEGDAKKLSKSGITADAEGQFWDSKGHVIGRAKTVAVEDADEESPFAGLEGLIVVKDGFVEDENGNRVGQVVEGDPKKLVGRAVDEDGDILDKKGSVVGHAERWEEAEPEPEVEPDAIDLSSLNGRTLNKMGMVIGDEGVPIARLVEGNAKELAGKKVDDKGQIWNDSGKVIGRVELIPEDEREAKPEGPFAGLEGLRVVADGKVADEDDNIVGQIVEGNPKRLIGNRVDEDGDIIDKYGNVKGHAEPIEDEEEIPIDNSILDGKKLNKQGFVVNDEGIPIGKLIEGNVKELAGRRCDEEGLIHGDTGKVVGRCEVLPESERVAKPEGPFAGLEGLHVNKDGFVEDAEGNLVGKISEGNVKRLVGLAVDEDGDINDKYGNVKGHAEPWEPEEDTPEDLSALAGCTVNKAGNVVDSSGKIIGRIAEGDPKSMIGKKVDGQGQIWDNAGNVIGRAELAKGQDTSIEGPFAGFDDIKVNKEGLVVTPDGTIVGRVIEGDIKKLIAHAVDEEGDIQDKNGNLLGKAERWEPEEKKRTINPMSGRKVNKEGEVRDENGDVLGRLTMGDLGHCVGLEIDDNGYVIDNDGNKVGEVTLLENIVEEEEQPEMTEEEQLREQERQVAEKMGAICTQTLERIQPVCKQITDHMEKADRTPKEELDEEELVNNVKPLIEEGGRILQECNGSLRGLDPDGKIAAQAKARAGTKEASPEEYRLADTLKELTTTVVTTIDNAKKRLNDMPHAKKKLNPLWGLLTQPLFQILAAVGLLLTGVLGLVGQLLNGLGLGGLVNGLLGGLGIKKLLGGLGLGGVGDSLGLGGKKGEKKGGGVSNIPVIGGLLGGGK
ncbi:hypothetical protein MBLNU459_g7421t1 [Dothideomycetes sp. NU459]